jgi:hypothetical protein
MMHTKRCWGVGPAASADELARKLTQSTWCLCTGFYVVGHEEYLFLNDATHEDGAGEYAVLKGRIGSTIYVQVESITFSWCKFAEALAYIQQAITGQMDESDFKTTLPQLRVQTLDEHGRCGLCA